jgi:hypothetical protein
MFFGGMREQLSNEVQLQDVPIEAFRLLLKYIYSGRIRFQSIKFDVILDVFTLVHKFSFQDLEVALCEYLKVSWVFLMLNGIEKIRIPGYFFAMFVTILTRVGDSDSRVEK